MKKQALTLALLLALALAGRGQYESFFGNRSWFVAMKSFDWDNYFPNRLKALMRAFRNKSIGI